MKFVLLTLASACAVGCVSHALSSDDAAQLQRSERLIGGVYSDLDAGLSQAKARAAYCGVNDVLAHSGDAPEAGAIACLPTP